MMAARQLHSRCGSVLAPLLLARIAAFTTLILTCYYIAGVGSVLAPPPMARIAAFTILV